jgi:hypothetical protein
VLKLLTWRKRSFLGFNSKKDLFIALMDIFGSHYKISERDPALQREQKSG